MKKLLITGAAGFIGSHVADDFLQDNWNVTAVDNFDSFYNQAIKRANVAKHLAHPSYRLVEADVRNLNSLSQNLSGDYDVIIHLAAKAGVRPSIDDPIAYQETNVGGTHNLLELARAWQTPQFVFASSSSVYGVNPNAPWTEDDKVLLPISPYASSKVSGELLGHVYSHLFGIRFLGLRFFTVYGPRQRPDLAIHKFARLMLAGQPIPIFGIGETRRDYTYIADIVSGIRAAAAYSATPYELFNLGNDRPVSLLELVETIADALKVRPVLQFQSAQSGDVPQTWANIEKARTLLSYQPKTALPQGIHNFVAWLNKKATMVA